METSGLVYVAGSHLWDKLYKPVPATPRDNLMLDEAKGHEDCPMFHTKFDNPEYEFRSWDMDPGNCLIHHPLAVHGSGKNASRNSAGWLYRCGTVGGMRFGTARVLPLLFLAPREIRAKANCLSLEN